MGNSNHRLDSLTVLRRELHQYPELSGEEYETSQRIKVFLENYPPDELLSGIGTTGLLAIYNGLKKGKTILFRTELDALAISETNTFEHQSLREGVSHKCGHDGHMAIMCGLAVELSHNRPRKGKVALLFQPAEEDGSGAKKVFEDPNFQSLQPDFVFALHNLPGFTLGQIVVKEKTFSCSVNSIIIKLIGKTAHAGEPENGINPSLAIAEIISEFNKLIQSDIKKNNFCMITPIHIRMGRKAYGVSAGAGEIHFTVRSDSNSKMKLIESKLETLAKKIANKNQLKCQINWVQEFQANENNKLAVNHIRKAARLLDLTVIEKKTPFNWGEDFGLFTQNYPGAMFGIGAGEDSPALHNPDYDFPDEITNTAVSLFHQISKQISNAH